MRAAWNRFRAGVVRNLFLSLLGVLALARQAPAGAPAADLAADLFAEGRWPACIRECARACLAEPEQPAPRVLGAIARLRAGGRTAAALVQLEQVAVAGTNGLAALAAFEAGRARWRQGDATNAFIQARIAVRLGGQPELFARSSCLLSEILRKFPGLGKEDDALVQTLETCRPLWTSALAREVLAPAAVPTEAASAFPPVRWIVALYRANIRPAIGSRCSLTPSCSEYFLQAGREHTLLAFPLVADRLVREPGVVQAAEHPVLGPETIRYADPLADHDFWLRAKGTK